MHANELSTLPAGMVGSGLPLPGGLWGLLGSDILASSANGAHGPGLAANDSLTPGLRYVYALESRSSAAVLLFPDSSHEGPVPYSGTVRLYEQGTGEVAGTVQQRTFSVTAGVAVPAITTQPQAQSVVVGATATFTVVASGPGLAYQWRRNGADIAGAVASSHSFTAQLADDGAQFSVLVSNAGGSVASSQAGLAVASAGTAPTITVQPQAQVVAVGDDAAFAVVAVGTAPLAYQWRRNGVDIAGATAASYLLPNAQQADSGAVFSVRVSNASGQAVSGAALLSVQSGSVAPSVTLQPVSQTVQAGATVTLVVEATGTAPLSYQWRRNGAAIAGATSAAYVFTADLAHTGSAYTVVVNNSFGSAQSQPAMLTVLASTAPPAITLQPAMQVMQEGETAVFTVAAVGAAPIAYQWRRNGVDIPGATAAALSLPNVGLMDSRHTFQVVVSNAHGQAVSSRVELVVPVVSVAEAKTGARIDDNRFDGDLPRWIDAAVRLAEQFCNTYFTPKAPGFDRVDWPTVADTFPVNSATACAATYWDGAAWVPLGFPLVVFADGSRTGVAPPAGQVLPALGTVPGGPRVRLVFAAGPNTAAALPIEVRHFVIAHVSLWADENRAAAPQAAQNFPWLYAGLEPLKVY